MTPVHPLGSMGDATSPEYRQLTVWLPSGLVDALDEHLRTELDMAVDATHRDALIALALRYLLEHWPDIGPAYKPGGAANATVVGVSGDAPATGRTGPAASGGDR